MECYFHSLDGAHSMPNAKLGNVDYSRDCLTRGECLSNIAVRMIKCDDFGVFNGKKQKLCLRILFLILNTTPKL